jgi:hypothetical protein
MNCRAAKKHLPLLAGNDLKKTKARRVEGHLASCEKCRALFGEYKDALARIKTLAREESLPDWQEGEWKALMKGIVSQKPEARRFTLRLSPRVAFAGASILLALIILAAILLKSRFIAPGRNLPPSPPLIVQEKAPPATAEEKKELPAPAPEKPQILAEAKKHSDVAARPAPRIRQREKSAGEESLSVMLVSQETGLRIYWTFNKNFEWKENGK